jgi:1,4-dihydroxy-2-naphthoyl-CoA synthase
MQAWALHITCRSWLVLKLHSDYCWYVAPSVNLRCTNEVYNDQTGELITGQQAKELGLVLASYEKDQVLPESLKLAEAIAANAPETVKHTTVTLRMHQDVGLEAGLQR